MIQRKPTQKSKMLYSFVSGFSFIGLVILAVSTFSFPVLTTIFAFQKNLISSFFVAICILGIVVGIFPSGCSRLLNFRNSNRENRKPPLHQEYGPSIYFLGHHPTCGNFSIHILTIDGKTYCAGCTGLIVGALLSLVSVIFYSFSNIQVGESSVPVFWIGFVVVSYGLFQYHLPGRNTSLLHVLVNTSFVFGAFLLLVGVHEITGSFVLEVYLFILMIYWIITRMIASQFAHRQICVACSKCCTYY
ncbi:hypothetical protein MUP77_12485 [Candidatus Bathyarchaeota archaeon]|nr:hypothetical protein [Candidatus Bathyarchaeota archaeon]